MVVAVMVVVVEVVVVTAAAVVVVVVVVVLMVLPYCWWFWSRWERKGTSRGERLVECGGVRHGGVRHTPAHPHTGTHTRASPHKQTTRTHACVHRYKITGHSGDTDDLTFVDWDAPPRTRKERLEVIRKMNAHAESCDSGDNTLSCCAKAVRAIHATDPSADEHVVVLLSDANFEQYGIGPEELRKLFLLDPRVEVFVLFIGSTGTTAEKMETALPRGRAFCIRDTATIPQILRQIFAFTMLRAKI